MDIGKSVRKSLDEWSTKDFESAILHACNAVDATASTRYPADGNKRRMIKFIRDSYPVFRRFGLPGVNLKLTQFPVSPDQNGDIKMMDAAEAIYTLHRCAHAHGDTISEGFELIHSESPVLSMSFDSSKGTLKLPTMIIIGLLASVILAEENAEKTLDMGGAFLTYQNPDQSLAIRLDIDQWWGRSDDFLQVASKFPSPLEVEFKCLDHVT